MHEEFKQETPLNLGSKLNDRLLDHLLGSVDRVPQGSEDEVVADEGVLVDIEQINQAEQRLRDEGYNRTEITTERRTIGRHSADINLDVDQVSGGPKIAIFPRFENGYVQWVMTNEGTNPLRKAGEKFGKESGEINITSGDVFYMLGSLEKGHVERPRVVEIKLLTFGEYLIAGINADGSKNKSQ